MRQPPPVDFPLGRCRLLAFLLVIAGLLPLLQGLLWWHSQSASSEQRSLAGLVLVLGLFWAGWAWRVWLRWPSGRLRWIPSQSGPADESRTGQWRWCDARVGTDQALLGIEVALDLQSHALLRLRSTEGRALWVSASRSADPSRWLELRRAWTASSS